jgi:chromatin structure-remodeling complex subunit RSC1/2
MAGDAIEVRESIEAKGDVNEDVEMKDAHDAITPKLDARNSDAKNEADADAEADPDADADADADGEVDEEVDAEGEEENDEDDEGRQSVPVSNSHKDLINLIRECADYLCEYEEE